MKQITCVIVEDEPLARKLLEEYVEKIPSLTLLASFGNPLLVLDYLRENEVDLLFSDIQMKEITGITLLKLLNNKPLVVLTTAYSEYALEGFELDVVDYLLKPITFERFLKAVEKVTQRLQAANGLNSTERKETPPATEDDFIFIKEGSKLTKVRFSDILHIKGLKDYVKITTKAGQIVTLQTMKSMEAILSPAHFIRIHNSTIVAFDAIEEIERDKVKIGDYYFSVSDSYKKAFKAFIDKRRI